MNDDKLKLLIELDDDIFYNSLLNQDIFYNIIKNKDEIIMNSVKNGNTQADLILYEYDKTVKNLISKYNLNILYEESINVFGVYDLAIFEEPDTIIFNIGNLKRIYKEIEILNIDIFKNINIEDIVILHEIYHKIESDKNLYTNNVYLSYTKMGFINKKVKLTSPSEIGAMSFAKRLMKLKFNPMVLNYILARTFNKEDIVFYKLINKELL